MFLGYRPFIISTIVDIYTFIVLYVFGYRPFIISTIVDIGNLTKTAEGYRPFIISTIVDDKVVCALNSYWLQACINFRAKRVAMLTFQNPLPLRLFKLSILLSIQPYKKEIPFPRNIRTSPFTPTPPFCQPDKDKKCNNGGGLVKM